MVAVALSLGLGAACDTANAPTTPGTSGAAPAITTLAPASPATSDVAQVLGVTGQNFRTGLTITLRAPDGSSTTYSGQDVTVQSPTSSTVSVTLRTDGLWTATAKNVDGLESTAFQFTVVATGGSGPAPVVLAISPNPITASANAQSLAISGTDFRAGLTVTFTDPAGTSGPVTVTGQDETLISVSATLTTPGTYTVTVRNADGTMSPSVSLTVNAPPGN